MEKPSILSVLKIIIVISSPLLLVFTGTRISSIPFWFIYLDVGRVIGPIYGLILLIFSAISVFMTFFWIFYSRHMTDKMIFSKLKLKRIQKLIFMSLIICLIIFSLLPFVFLLRVSEVDEIDGFIRQNSGADLPSFVNNISSFLSDNIQSSYRKPEALFEIDQQVFNSILDYHIMETLGITRADVIIYQGWGSCGQVAFVIEELLYEFGYDSRRATFIGIDHAWAEVYYEGEWQIVDPWYIGNMVKIQDLSDLKPQFKDALGVEVMFRNGSIANLSEDYGY